MKIEIQPDGIWYHSSNKVFAKLRKNSTITPCQELAEALSNQPAGIGYDDNRAITHDAQEKDTCIL